LALYQFTYIGQFIHSLTEYSHEYSQLHVCTYILVSLGIWLFHFLETRIQKVLLTLGALLMWSEAAYNYYSTNFISSFLRCRFEERKSTVYCIIYCGVFHNACENANQRNSHVTCMAPAHVIHQPLPSSVMGGDSGVNPNLFEGRRKMEGRKVSTARQSVGSSAGAMPPEIS